MPSAVGGGREIEKGRERFRPGDRRHQSQVREATIKQRLPLQDKKEKKQKGNKSLPRLQNSHKIDAHGRFK